MLLKLLRSMGHATTPAPSVPKFTGLGTVASTRTIEVYQALGGIEAEPRLAPGGWDLSFLDFVVELDEELHFNRYRLSTLSASWSDGLPWADEYRLYSARYEAACLAAGSWGKRWTTRRAEAQFGPAGASRDLSGSGAPRWKQRAQYDCMKDTLAMSGNVRLVRLSIYDLVGEVPLEAVLRGQAKCDLEDIDRLVHRRTTGRER